MDILEGLGAFHDILEIYERLKGMFTKHERQFIVVDEKTVSEIENLLRKVDDLAVYLAQIPEGRKLLESIREFQENIVILYLREEDKWLVCNSRDVAGLVEELLKKPRGITIIGTSRFVRESEGLRKKKSVKKEILEALEKLPKDIRKDLTAIILLSIEIERLYSEGEYSKAEEMRRSIRETFGERGLKICNLYQRGYLKNFLKLKGKSMTKEDLDWFFDATRYVFFIYADISIGALENILNEIHRGFSENATYVALHSLGSASMWVKYLVSRIEAPESYSREVVERNNDYSVVFYRGDTGNFLYSLLWR